MSEAENDLMEKLDKEVRQEGSTEADDSAEETDDARNTFSRGSSIRSHNLLRQSTSELSEETELTKSSRWTVPEKSSE